MDSRSRLEWNFGLGTSLTFACNIPVQTIANTHSPAIEEKRRTDVDLNVLDAGWKGSYLPK